MSHDLLIFISTNILYEKQWGEDWYRLRDLWFSVSALFGSWFKFSVWTLFVWIYFYKSWRSWLTYLIQLCKFSVKKKSSPLLGYYVTKYCSLIKDCCLMYSAWIRIHLKKLSVLAPYFKWDKVEQLNKASMVSDHLRDGWEGWRWSAWEGTYRKLIAGCKYLKGYCGEEWLNCRIY